MSDKETCGNRAFPFPYPADTVNADIMPKDDGTSVSRVPEWTLPELAAIRFLFEVPEKILCPFFAAFGVTKPSFQEFVIESHIDESMRYAGYLVMT
jgi:hypothetical protein